MLEVLDLTVRYGRRPAVSQLSMRATDTEVLCVLGPSGCGKSTLLRAIAGLVNPESGTIRLDGRNLDGLRPDERQVGLMFQDHALFPHRSVAENVAFGPRMQRLSRTDIERRVRESLELVDLVGTGGRPVGALSGGEQQRVALARAIAARPRLLMLDEPLGSLDRALRDRLLVDLPVLFERLGTTVIYVTHDQDEALALADRIVVMRAGSVAQVGEPEELWRGPRTPFVAGFLGFETILPVEVVGGVAATPFGEVPLPDRPDGRAQIVLLFDALRLVSGESPRTRASPSGPGADRPGPGEREIVGRVTGRRFAGDHVRLRVLTSRGIEVTVPVWREMGPRPGEEVQLALDLRAVHALEPDEPLDAPSAEPGVVAGR